MEQLKDWNPSSWDSKANYAGDRSRFHWFVAPVILTRDADLLEKSNWDTACKMLDVDKQSGVEMHNFGHWACGYYDIILIHPWNKKAIAIGEDIESSLSDYPILDDDDFSRRELEDRDTQWDEHGYDDLQDRLCFRLFGEYCDDTGYDKDWIISYDTYHVRNIVESQYHVIDEQTYFDEKQVDRTLKGTSTEELWKNIFKLSLPKYIFNALPHALYHQIQAQSIAVTDYDTGEPLAVPDFIAVQYNQNQQTIEGYPQR